MYWSILKTAEVPSGIDGMGGVISALTKTPWFHALRVCRQRFDPVVERLNMRFCAAYLIRERHSLGAEAKKDSLIENAHMLTLLAQPDSRASKDKTVNEIAYSVVYFPPTAVPENHVTTRGA